MTTTGAIFNIQLVLGYVFWLLCFSAYLWPWLKKMEAIDAQRAIATLHSIRFIGLVFIVPGVVGALPPAFAQFAAWGDLVTGILAMAALLTAGRRSLFWMFVMTFNTVGVIDLLGNYFNAVRLGLPDDAGQLGAAYLIPILSVPLFMITHIAAFMLMTRSRRTAETNILQATDTESLAGRA